MAVLVTFGCLKMPCTYINECRIPYSLSLASINRLDLWNDSIKWNLIFINKLHGEFFGFILKLFCKVSQVRRKITLMVFMKQA